MDFMSRPLHSLMLPQNIYRQQNIFSVSFIGHYSEEEEAEEEENLAAPPVVHLHYAAPLSNS